MGRQPGGTQQRRPRAERAEDEGVCTSHWQRKASARGRAGWKQHVVSRKVRCVAAASALCLQAPAGPLCGPWPRFAGGPVPVYVASRKALKACGCVMPHTQHPHNAANPVNFGGYFAIVSGAVYDATKHHHRIGPRYGLPGPRRAAPLRPSVWPFGPALAAPHSCPRPAEQRRKPLPTPCDRVVPSSSAARPPFPHLQDPSTPVRAVCARTPPRF
jgi:hypothetical protein